MKNLALFAMLATLVTACSTDRGGGYYIDDASAYHRDSGNFSNSKDTLGQPTGPGMRTNSWSMGERGTVP